MDGEREREREREREGARNRGAMVSLANFLMVNTQNCTIVWHAHTYTYSLVQLRAATKPASWSKWKHHFDNIRAAAIDS